MAFDVTAPVRRAQLGAAGNHDCPQLLIAYQSKVGTIHD
jgi:hypothetical protein